MNKSYYEFKNHGNDAAIVFIHGFTGKVRDTWADLPWYLAVEPRLSTWDVHAVGYPTSLRIDIGGWDKDPDIAILAQSFGVALKTAPLSHYAVLVIAAHSMGGLVAQKALLDDNALTGRVRHLFLFGTPSDGLVKARFGRWFKSQIRDLADDSAFMTGLRVSRKAWTRGQPPFQIHAVAGDRDDFVPKTSSLDPFPPTWQRVIPGNHLEIVKPTGRDHHAVTLLKAALQGDELGLSIVDGARIALEHRQFKETVEKLESNATQLDEKALVDLALALDGLGQAERALKVLTNRDFKTTDALGVLAGRIKRRWLLDRVQADWERARSLYAQGLEGAEQAQDADQATYHAINIAFLDLMITPEAPESSPGTVKKMARKALDYCAKASGGHWCLATQGEAHLMLGEMDQARAAYEQAIRLAPSPRAVHSMYVQALRVAEHLFGESGATKIERLFNPFS